MPPSCDLVTCLGTENCIDGVCVPATDSCNEVLCPIGLCISGLCPTVPCVEDCPLGLCINGKCPGDPCYEILCSFGECVEGMCPPNPCIDVSCDIGQTCMNG